MTKIGVQTFTIRKHLKKPKAILSAFEQLKALGMNAVELARVDFNDRAIIETVRKACLSLDISVEATQITFDKLKNDFGQIIEMQHLLNCKTACVSVLPTKYILNNGSKLNEFTAELDALGKKYAESGIRLLYHHHHFEFRKFENKLLLDIILENTHKEHVGLVCDTYWTQRGGKNPADFIANPAHRVEAVHLRDYRIRWQYFDLLPTDAEVGLGNLNIPKIIETCVAGKVNYLAIEQATINRLIV